MLCFVNFEKIEVFQVLRLPRSPAGKHKISKLFHFFCFSFRGQSWVHFILHHAPFQLNFFSTEFCHVTLIVDGFVVVIVGSILTLMFYMAVVNFLK